MMIKYFGIGSFIIYGILILILVINENKQNKIIKYSFLGLFFIASVIFLYFNQEIIDQVLRMLIRYIYFPSFNSYLITIFLTLCVLLYSILSEKMSKIIKIVNYIFSCLLIVTYVIFMMLKVDVSSYNSLYSSISLICIRYSARAFIVWLTVVLSIKYFRSFINER